MNLNKIKLALILLVCLCSCNDKEPDRPGIYLSFDDRSVNEWYELKNLLKGNNVTFFITQPRELTSKEIDKLHELHDDGHEIGFHGCNHVLSEQYIKEYSYLSYFKNEIWIGLDVMDSLGFNCTSFAYPYGAKYRLTDFLLSLQFKTIRGVAPINPEKDLTSIESIYTKRGRFKVTDGIGIDLSSGITKKMIDEALRRVKEKNEIISLYGHVPILDKYENCGSFDVDLLRYIVDSCNKMGISFIRASELD